MLKKLLILLGILMLILTVTLAGSAYYAYQHRQELTSKALNYALQNMGNSLVPQTLMPATEKSTNTGLDNILGLLKNPKNNADNIDLTQIAQQALTAFGNFQKNIPTENNGSVHDINARDKKGRTLLMNVCRTDASADIIKMLLQYGADLTAIDNQGRTTLMYAVALNQNIDVIKLLIAAGADLKVQDKSGKTVLDYATTPEIYNLLSAR